MTARHRFADRAEVWIAARSALWLTLVGALLLAGCAGRSSGPGAGPVAVPQGGGFYKVGTPYQIDGRWYYPREDWNYDQIGMASWYGETFQGRPTANGEVFDMHALTAAHPTLPMPTRALVTNLENGRSVEVRINDRGPFKRDRIIDLSMRAAQELGFFLQGTARVRVQMLGRAPLGPMAEVAPDAVAPMIVPASGQIPRPVPPGGVPLAAVRAKALPPPEVLAQEAPAVNAQQARAALDRLGDPNPRLLDAPLTEPALPGLEPMASASMLGDPNASVPAIEAARRMPQPEIPELSEFSVEAILAAEFAGQEIRTPPPLPPEPEPVRPLVSPLAPSREPDPSPTPAPSSLPELDLEPGPAPAPPPVQTRAAAPPPAAATLPEPPRETRQVFIQLGAFLIERNAREVIAELTGRTDGLGELSIWPIESRGRTLHRVRLGPLSSEAQAREARDRLIALGYLDTTVVID